MTIAWSGDGRLAVWTRGRACRRGEERRLFERFQRGRADRPGTGLGLAIVETLARRWGGSASIGNARQRRRARRGRVPGRPLRAPPTSRRRRRDADRSLSGCSASSSPSRSASASTWSRGRRSRSPSCGSIAGAGAGAAGGDDGGPHDLDRHHHRRQDDDGAGGAHHGDGRRQLGPRPRPRAEAATTRAATPGRAAATTTE